MEKSVIRTKRKALTSYDEKPKQTLHPEAIKVSKDAQKKSKQKERGEEGMLVKMESEENEKVQSLNGLLPTIKREPNKAISDEDLAKLFFALCGDTGKLYDSDDSIISEIDAMDADEIAARDRNHRETMEFIRKLPEQHKRLFQIHRIGKETPEEREERRNIIRELQREHMNQAEKEKDEKKRLKRIKLTDKRLDTVIDFFHADREKIKLNPKEAPLLTARQFARCLEVIAECIVKDEYTADGHLDVRKTIMKIDVETLNKSLKTASINDHYFCNDMTPAAYLKKKMRKIFRDEDIMDVLDGHRYGFDFNGKDHIHALVNYYIDDKKGRKHLNIDIRSFVASAFYVARTNSEEFQLNENLIYAMFG